MKATQQMKGYCKVVGVSVGYVKLATGYLIMDLTLEVKGRPSEMFFESNMSGSLLTNSHSITTGNTTYTLSMLFPLIQ